MVALDEVGEVMRPGAPARRSKRELEEGMEEAPAVEVEPRAWEELSECCGSGNDMLRSGSASGPEEGFQGQDRQILERRRKLEATVGCFPKGLFWS